MSRDNPDQGYHTYVSPDGLHWTRHSEKRNLPRCRRHHRLLRSAAQAVGGVGQDLRCSGRQRAARLLADHQPRLHHLERAEAGPGSRRPRRCRRDGPHRGSSLAARCSRRPRSDPDRILRRRLLSGRKLRARAFLGSLRSTIRPATAIKKGPPSCNWPSRATSSIGSGRFACPASSAASPSSGTPASSSRQAKHCASATKSGSTTAAPTIRTAPPASIVPTIRRARPSTPARSAWPSGRSIVLSRSTVPPKGAG